MCCDVFHSIFFYYISLKKQTAGCNLLNLFHDSLMGWDPQSEKCELISIIMFLGTTELFLSYSIKYLDEDIEGLFSNLQIIR